MLPYHSLKAIKPTNHGSRVNRNPLSGSDAPVSDRELRTSVSVRMMGFYYSSQAMQFHCNPASEASTNPPDTNNREFGKLLSSNHQSPSSQPVMWSNHPLHTLCEGQSWFRDRTYLYTTADPCFWRMWFHMTLYVCTAIVNILLNRMSMNIHNVCSWLLQ